MNNRHCVVFFHPYFMNGGAEKTNLQHSKNIIQQGHDVYFASIQFDDFFESQIEALNVKKLHLKSKRSLLSLPKLLRHVNKLSQDYSKVHLISCQNFANCLTALIKPFLNSNVTTYFFDRNHFSELEFKGGIKNQLTKLIIPFAYQAADYVLTNSKESSSYLESKIFRPVITVYNPSLEGELPKHFKAIDSHEICIGSIGRVEKQKNFSLLIEAFSEIEKIYPHSKLIIAGSGSQLSELKELSHHLKIKNIEFLGQVSNVKDFYNQLNLFVLSSNYEGLPNTLLEALSYGIPSVSTSCPSGPKEILKNGVFGPLTEPRNKADLIQKIITRIKEDKVYLKNSSNRLSEHLKNFHIEYASKDLIRLIEEQV